MAVVVLVYSVVLHLFIPDFGCGMPQREEKGLEYTEPMPTVPAPEEVTMTVATLDWLYNRDAIDRVKTTPEK